MANNLYVPPERIVYLEGDLFDEQILSVEEALGSKRYLGVLTTPALVKVMAVVATHETDTPIIRHELMQESKLSESIISKAVQSLSRVGAVRHGAAMAYRGNIRSIVHTVAPGPTLPTFIEAIPNWQKAIERRLIDKDLQQIAGELGVSQDEALRVIISSYRRLQTPSAE